MKQIPIMLLTGFLGSGKTTFLNRLIQTHPSRKISIILNEFGDVQLESQFIEEKDAFVAELKGGCMCCIAKSDVPHVIHIILDKSPQTQYIIVEASGLSYPEPIRETLEGPGLSDRIFFDKTVAIVDTINYEDTKSRYQIITSQIADSDIVLISKASQAGSEKTEQIKKQLEIMIDVPVLIISDNLNPDDFLTEQPREVTAQQTPVIQPPEHSDHDEETHIHDHDHEEYDQLWFETEQPLNMLKFQTIMNNLPEGIVRSKGFIKILDEENAERKLLIQYVNGKFEMQADEWKKNQKKQTAIVFLGKDFNTQDLNIRLQSCIA